MCGLQSAHSGSKLLEDFDFIAMNEKFNKEEVWDELLKVESKDRVSEGTGATQGLDYSLECKELERTFDGSPSDLSRRVNLLRSMAYIFSIYV